MEEVSRFMDNPSAAYRDAVRALRVLADAEGEEMATRAFGEAVAELRRADWAAENGFEESQAHQSIHGLLGRQALKDGVLYLPGGDHTSVWNKEGKPHTLVSQPYDLRWEDLTELVAFCKQWGLMADVAAWPSWHFPGSALSVMVRRQTNEGR